MPEEPKKYTVKCSKCDNTHTYGSHAVQYDSSGGVVTCPVCGTVNSLNGAASYQRQKW